MSLSDAPFSIPLQDALSFLLNKPLTVLFIGAILCFLLHIWTEYQTYQYFKSYASDVPFSRRLVLAILTLETLNVGLCILAECQDEAHRHLAIIPIDQWLVQSFTPFSVLVLLSCQRIYAHCVHLISLRHRVFVAVAVLLALTGLGFIVAAIMQGHLSRGSEEQDVDWYLLSGFGAALLAGLGLTGSLVTILLCGQQGLQYAHSLSEIMTVYALNAGLLMSTFALVSIIFAVVRPEHLPVLGVVFMCVKLFTSARLAVKLHLYHLQVPTRRCASETTKGDTRQAPRGTHISTAMNIPQVGSPLYIHFTELTFRVEGSPTSHAAEERKEPLIVV
ncbi:hypothetical protein C8Q80DRAFT_1269757 [Daedaleopsis nitida]|nr:hypothetical protein C8Q80DRAFT_1269757 [Daedaleopsis nitida]